MFVIDVGVAVLRKYGIGGTLRCKVITTLSSVTRHGRKKRPLSKIVELKKKIIGHLGDPKNPNL